MTPLRPSRREQGFTLLELIVAAGILALIAVFSWRGLDALVREREAIAGSQAALDVLQRSFARIERDALLAGDAQLDDGNSLRLVAGPASVDSAPTVEYRLDAGTLSRSVAGVDRTPLAMVDGVASLAFEAWTPTPRGGSWVRTKGLATPPPRPAPPPTGAAAPAPTNAAPPGTAPPLQSGGVTAPVAGPPIPLAGGVPAATGIRLTLAFADGTRVVRAFIVGGG